MKLYFPYSTLFLFVFLFAPIIGMIQDFYIKDNQKIYNLSNLYEISKNWEYQWGNSNMEPISETHWKAISLPVNPPHRDKQTILWLKNKLPYGKWETPHLLIDGKGVLLTFEVFLNDSMIYKFGELTPNGKGNISGVTSHLIELDENFQGKVLTLKVFSDYSNIGIRGKMILGSKSDLIMRIIKKDIHRSLLGFFMILIGIIELFTYQKSINKIGSVSMFGILSISIGLYIVSLTSLKDLIFYAPIFWLNMYIVAMTLIPVGMMGFIWQEFRPEKNNYLHRIWQFHVGYAVFCQALFVLALFSLCPLWAGTFTLNILRYFLILEMVLMVGITFKDSVIKKDYQARIYFCGFLPIMIAGTHDALVGLGKIESSISYVPWTLIIFILSLEFIQRLRNIRTQKKLRDYAGELEKKDEERMELINDLHDGIGGLLTNIKFLSEMGLRSTSTDGIKETFSNISELSSDSLIEIGSFMQSLDGQETSWDTLLTSFYHLGDTIIKPRGLSFKLLKRVDNTVTDPDQILFLNLLRIYKEALTNIAKHSNATSVCVEFVVNLEQISLSVQDDGLGFEADVTKGKGVNSMKKRAEKLGGLLTIESTKGTRILLKIKSL